ncbi:MAG: imidazole glycerol phosphate synthase subunit HisH [Armatimonadetes bacterium]|nr:imidazole glycerol phosphate synthase subunit HisH [Armatimonadota bacterium]
MIAVVDYGMGNLGSVEKALKFVGADARLTDDPADVAAADAVVLPGVGAFDDCVAGLRDRGLIRPVLAAIEAAKPFLGICLGLQVLFESSEEAQREKGLGLFRGQVVRFRHDLKIPQIGWNQIFRRLDAPHLASVPDGAWVYFVHSYHVAPEDESLIATVTEYGYEFVSSVWRDNVFASQFHPEKSQRVGLQILRNFVALVQGQSAAAQ